MALNLKRSKGSGMDLSDPEVRSYIMQQLDIEEPKPKASVLKRLTSALSAFETGNAVYKAMEEDNILAGLGQYVSDIGTGLSSIVTGNVDEEKKTYSDVLDELGVENKTVRAVGGFLGDVALDPTTYITIGAGGGVKLGGKTLTSSGAKIVKGKRALALGKIAENGIESFAKKNGLEYAGRAAREVADEFAEKELTKFAAKTGANYFKKDAMRFAGKEVLDLTGKGKLMTGLKSYFDPLSAAVEGANKTGIGKKASTAIGEILYPVRKLFSRSSELAQNGAFEKEFKPLLDGVIKLRDSVRYSQGVADRKAMEWYNLMEKTKVNPEIFPHVYENAPEEIWRQLPEDMVSKLDEFYSVIKGAMGQGDVPKELVEKVPIEQLSKQVEEYQTHLAKGAEFIADPAKQYTSKLLSDDANMGQFLDLVEKNRLRAEEITRVLQEVGALEEGVDIPYLARQMLETPSGKVVGRGKGLASSTSAFKNRTYKFLAETEIAGGKTTTTGKVGEEARAAIAEQIGKTEALAAKAMAFREFENQAIGFRDSTGNLISKSYGELREFGGDATTRQVEDVTQKFLNDEHKGLHDYVNEALGARLEEAKANIWSQLDAAEAGKRVSFRDEITDQLSYMAKKSSYPDWLPEYLRKQDIVKKVRDALMGNYDIKPGSRVEEAYSLAIKEAKNMVDTRDMDDLIDELSTLNKQAGMTKFLKEEALDLRTEIPSLVKNGAYRQIRSSLNGKILFEGKYFPREIADLMEQTHKSFFGNENMNEILKLYDKVLSGWKKSVTAFFPGFHVRNGLSNAYMNWMAGVKSPKVYNEAKDVQKFMNTIVKYGYDSKEAKEAGSRMIGKTGMNIRDLLDVAERNGVVQSGTFYDEISSGAIKNRSKKLSKVLSGFSGAGNYIEENAKLAHFIDKLNKGYSINDAALSVKKYLFDYGDLTDFEKNVMRRIMPFYTWTRKNVELQLKEMVSKPGQYSIPLKLFRDIEDAFTDISEEDKAKLPSWVKDGVEIVTGEDGRARAIYSFGTPVEAFSQAVGGIIPGTDDPSLLSNINPIAKFFTERTFDKSMFTGEALSTDQDARNWRNILGAMPQELKDLIGYREIERTTSKGTKYTEYMMNPDAKHLINTLFSRFASTAGKITTASDAGYKATALDFMTGFKVKEFDLNEEEAKRQREMEEALYKELMKKGLAKEMYKPYLTREAKNNLR